MSKHHVGDWIAFHAHAERTPPRLSVTFTLGELPQAWAESRRRAAETWTAIAGIVLILPFVVFLIASLLHGVGVRAPLDWIGSTSASIVAVSVSVFIGIPIAFVLNLWRVTQIGLRRRHGEVEGLVALEFAPLHLVVIAVAAIVGLGFVGHLAADSYACLNGVHSAC